MKSPLFCMSILFQGIFRVWSGLPSTIPVLSCPSCISCFGTFRVRRSPLPLILSILYILFPAFLTLHPHGHILNARGGGWGLVALLVFKTCVGCE